MGHGTMGQNQLFVLCTPLEKFFVKRSGKAERNDYPLTLIIVEQAPQKAVQSY